MNGYAAPLREMQFVLSDLANLDEIAALPDFAEATPDLVAAVLEEASKFASGVLSPLNPVGDATGSRWQDGEVLTPPGWVDAYKQFCAAGWTALAAPREHGGQGLPVVVSALVEEMWNGANIAFALSPLLTRGAIAALELKGSDALKERYLSRMVSGEWTGSMNLTEPQAGSDLAAVRTRAVAQSDGTYRIRGQKIFITYGEHDMTDNIVHLVLARTPDAPEGVKGISLFVVPKMILDDSGSPDVRNDVRCVSIEHKMGIRGSPTTVLAFGDKKGAVGYLVGEENRGLEYMFVMMNEARFAVGLQGIGLSERAYQRALNYAKDRTQGSEIGIKGGSKVAIIRHPDVRRMLMSMKCRIDAMRSLAGVVAASMDTARGHPEPTQRARSQAFVDLMMPVVKAWCTETGIEVTSLGIQIHGGMGFIEETGAAQHLRDARITTIYEGTTGIQAADLIGRKIAREKGQTMQWVVERMRETSERLAQSGDPQLLAIGKRLGAGIDALVASTDYMLATYDADVKRASVGAVPFLELFGIVAGGWQLGRAALAAQRYLEQGQGEAAFYRTKVLSSRFFAEHFLTRAPGLAQTVLHGASPALAIDDDCF
ncbi:acyl-CoA dehydrogenase [Variovorax sp. J22G21]|uniref:acyl-CoA dehydrogenase n=1 Tax=Variovorax fucosicus TaxID=3053517 RepID=UPI002574BE39|nr:MULTISPECIES: acyl-CoA dehydrogenase [unclassified Variovorax]MDM0037515.1 acyl-CoA dehydrogenase [Variovorax sp. J22R193]MDM0062291.1 acyl-CoA dehydrogenase [Variovorax sp. J22G21]